MRGQKIPGADAQGRTFRGALTAVLLVAVVAGVWSGTVRAEAAVTAPDAQQASTAVAVFAGGCFWCMEPPFEKLDGVREVVSGFVGGERSDPSYDDVAAGRTEHAEAVRILYDPRRIDYEDLLEVYWRQIDPTDGAGQFVDRGRQYRPAIFYLNERQRRRAEASKVAVAASGRFDESITVEVVPATRFWPAEAYHQDFYRTHAYRYKIYRWNSGRDRFLDEHWGEDRDWRPGKDAHTLF